MMKKKEQNDEHQNKIYSRVIRKKRHNDNEKKIH